MYVLMAPARHAGVREDDMKQPHEFLNVVNIPEAHVGEWRIKRTLIKAEHPFELANSRTAIIGGHRGKTLKFGHETTWHELKQGDGPGRWMSDLPIEQAQIDREVGPIKRGTVLVGGLGIGYVASILARRPGIKRVVVVELAPEVIQLVSEHVCKGETARAKLEFVQADLLTYLKGLPPQSFDHAYYDIWTTDGESTFFATVMPLLRLSATRVRQEPINWNESVMRGQLRMSLDSRGLMFRRLATRPPGYDPFREQMIEAWGSLEKFCEPAGNTWRDWSIGFFRWMRKHEPDDMTFNLYSMIYAEGYGRRGFEMRWRALAGEDVLRCELTRGGVE